MEIGDKVEKVGGDYTFVGEIVSKFEKTSGQTRYVVEDGRGILHIYSEKNLRPFRSTVETKLIPVAAFNLKVPWYDASINLTPLVVSNGDRNQGTILGRVNVYEVNASELVLGGLKDGDTMTGQGDLSNKQFIIFKVGDNKKFWAFEYCTYGKQSN